LEPILAWIDLTSSDRDRMRRMLDLFKEQGTIDEMGLGSLRDALADALFPGTSSIQTRARYVFFIPWLYQRLQRRDPGDDIAAAARKAELELIGALTAGDDTEGVIGSRARDQLTRLPSSVYWGALVRWGLFAPQQSQGWYHARFAALGRGAPGLAHPDDPGVVLTRETIWHARLPPAPDGFPREASFALRPDEAAFLQGRWEERCAGSLLGWLAREGCATPAVHFWEDPQVLRVTPAVNPMLADAVALARRFSLSVEGAPLLYNLLLAERRGAKHHSEGDQALVERYRAELHAWATREAEEPPFDTGRLWRFMAERRQRVPQQQRLFVDTWAGRRASIGAHAIADDAELRRRVELRERGLKGEKRARLANPERLLDWSGRVGVGRMDFRWSRVRQLLIDLHRGLAADVRREQAA
jgi:hypothetical protein